MLTINNRLIFLFITNIFIFKQAIAEDILKIGAMTSLSGNFSSYGEDCRRGYLIAEKYVLNNSSVKIIYADHQRESRKAISEFNRLTLSEGVKAFACDGTPAVMAINPLSKAKNIPITATSAHPKLLDNPYAYRFWINAKNEGKVLAEKAFIMGYRSMATVNLEDEYAIEITKSFIEEFEKLGGKIILSEQVLSSEGDFATVITRVKAANPDAILSYVLGDMLGVFIKRLREQGVSQQIFTTFSIAKKEILDNAGAANAEGAIFVEVDTNEPIFRAKMKEEFGVDSPNMLTYMCYASLSMVGTVIESNENKSSKENIIKAYQSVAKIKLLDNPIEISNREAKVKSIFKSIHQGKIINLLE